MNTSENCGTHCPNRCILSCFCDTCKAERINGYRPSPQEITQAKKEVEEARLNTREARREQMLQEKAERKAYEKDGTALRRTRKPTQAELEAQKEMDAMMREG